MRVAPVACEASFANASRPVTLIRTETVLSATGHRLTGADPRGGGTGNECVRSSVRDAAGVAAALRTRPGPVPGPADKA
ncbi:hypothetical protein PSA01_25510 [Pseudonocardia saturnea]|uniref:Uncharacterized protein n=1 Tax=Pseudonocardia saturnea TaxID=33909 RepID=A0ABQ0RXX3_9PSEU|nr:hypothetical protein Pdca_54000 [Pseudonocardia autotrophica]GEC25522.1 hypothetical protein PSA01_25510 [Pseudonocardia saturnea]